MRPPVCTSNFDKAEPAFHRALWFSRMTPTERWLPTAAERRSDPTRAVDNRPSAIGISSGATSRSSQPRCGHRAPPFPRNWELPTSVDWAACGASKDLSFRDGGIRIVIKPCALFDASSPHRRAVPTNLCFSFPLSPLPRASLVSPQKALRCSFLAVSRWPAPQTPRRPGPRRRRQLASPRRHRPRRHWGNGSRRISLSSPPYSTRAKQAPSSRPIISHPAALS
jgi:hypothetical protein